jgi:hypothetical protein
VGVAAPGGSAASAGGPASKFRRTCNLHTCNLHACGSGVACRELRAIGLTGDGLPLPRKERPTCGAQSAGQAVGSQGRAREAEMSFPRRAVDRTEDRAPASPRRSGGGGMPGEVVICSNGQSTSPTSLVFPGQSLAPACPARSRRAAVLSAGGDAGRKSPDRSVRLHAQAPPPHRAGLVWSRA